MQCSIAARSLTIEHDLKHHDAVPATRHGRDRQRRAQRVFRERQGLTMSVAIVTGASGLIGSEAVRFLAGKGMKVVGIDNNLRA